MIAQRSTGSVRLQLVAEPPMESPTIRVQHIDSCLAAIIEVIHVLWSVSRTTSVSTSSKQNLLTVPKQRMVLLTGLKCVGGAAIVVALNGPKGLSPIMCGSWNPVTCITLDGV